MTPIIVAKSREDEESTPAIIAKVSEGHASKSSISSHHHHTHPCKGHEMVTDAVRPLTGHATPRGRRRCTHVKMNTILTTQQQKSKHVE